MKSYVRGEIAEVVGISGLFSHAARYLDRDHFCPAVHFKSLAGDCVFDVTPACFALTLGNGQFNAASIDLKTEENIIRTAHLQADQSRPGQSRLRQKAKFSLLNHGTRSHKA